MSALAVAIVGLSLLLIWSGITNTPLFVGPDAAVSKVLRGAK